MAQARRQARARVRPHYREDSFDSAADDDDYSQSDAEIPPLSPLRHRRFRENSIVDSDGNVRRSPRTRRSQKVTLEEPPSDIESFIVSDGSEEDLNDDSEPEAKPVQTKKRRAVQPTKPVKRARTTTRRNPSQPRPRITYISPKKTLLNKKLVARMETDGVLPPWSTLPYMTLTRIFEYASWSYEDTSKARKKWLLSTALTCKTFCEPAITVLYNQLNATDFRQLTALQLSLASQTEESAFDYRAKVQQISLDERILQNAWNPNDVLRLLPVVNKLDIWSSKDVMRGHSQIASERWYNYPQVFFTDLQAKLKSWRLNGMMLASSDEIKLLYDLMASDGHPLNMLTELTVSNMVVSYPQCDVRFPMAPGYNDTTNFLPFLPKMPNLTKLRIEYCRAFHAGEPGVVFLGGVLKNLAPLRLTSLELGSCLDDSAELQEWLSHHGSSLTRLTIQNCPNMNMSFLQDLVRFCPRLERLYMDILLVDPSLHDRRIKPGFTQLMDPDQIPTWPETLQSIQLQHLQKWTIDEARVAFESLAEAAPRLKDLRTLAITASVDGPWKSRSSFRDEWKAKFEHIFRRKDVPPNKHLVSKKAWRLYQAGRKQKDDSVELSRLRNRRTGVNYGSSDSGTGDISEEFNNASGRKTNGTNGGLNHLAVRGSRDHTRRSGREDGNGKDLFVQGLCDIVDIRIDNQRPRDKEFNEDDFMEADDHDESDEDYEA
jgi:hypothetical protein